VDSHLFWQSDGYTYLLRDRRYVQNGDSTGYDLYRRPANREINTLAQAPYSLGAMNSGATWEGPLNPSGIGDDNTEFFHMTASGHLTISGTSFFGEGSISHLIVGRKLTVQ